MKLVIAEKPMLARDIARAICGKQVSETARLPISGNGYTVTACAGHLLELVEPETVNPAWGKPWSLDVLPIEIKDWPKEPTEDKKDLVACIRGLLDEADSVINAGDPDDEGQLIVDEVLDYLGYTGKVERVYVNDNIEKNIIKAFEHLVPNDECRPVGDAAYARQMADKCFGVNETRLATKRLDGMFSVGRVQTPTLGLVVTRDEQIANHTSRKYYELGITGDCPGCRDGAPTFKFKPDKELLNGEKHLYSPDALEALKEKLDGTDIAFETVLSESVAHPPLPYNLTVLLSDMSERYGFTAAKTQQIT
ncbi:MAG: DNA topoisomerase, partial [Coriobacteriaceae bacterium]|nr:DNA topoisomerase [Coriobacteriaceae bacterium]